MSKRSLILVTGAPRTATTPVGNVLATGKSTVSLYEPVGPTGLRRIHDRFPMVGPDIDPVEFTELVSDLAAFRFGGLNSQQRPGQPKTWKRGLIGSRTRITLISARMQPWAKHAIWKDPHALFLAPDAVEAGIPVVVTVRRAKAHAGSYARLGWRSQASEIYPKWERRFGPCKVVEAALDRAAEPIISAALIWRLSYLALIRTNSLDKVHLVRSEDLIEDEAGTYQRAFEACGLEMTSATQKILVKKKVQDGGQPKKSVTHDWTRTAAAANNYWSSVISEEQASDVDRITADIEELIF
jgi:hypothetical protein